MDDTYFIIVKGNTFKEVEGRKVMIKDIECFTHRNDDKTWNVTEAKSGMAVVKNYRLKEDAVTQAEKLIDRNYEWLLNQIAEKVAQGELSPRYA
ncbi:hypothetical protein [Paenibacillus pini]|uniref:Uncharacterized protein n=1 Tax=Paenibacillus pini JCM 16418 TaxID=1236976 RepID=W7YUG3_9BACL|nr:hypothetical protein [Paenibacillus pini]GAF10868.1 hypothetical protein JCM16418_5096 [Paenibacillus pini JCM 16418]